MEKQIYHRAKIWQMAFFSLNNCATNAYMFLMMYISYYATGIAGLGVAVVGVISTASRLWDGVTFLQLLTNWRRRSRQVLY